jgi:hypothetical protein
VDLVVVQKQALAGPLDQLQLLLLAAAVDIVAPAWLHALDHAHRSAANLLFGDNLPGNGLFVFARLDVLHRTAQSRNFPYRRRLEPIAGSFRMLSKLLQQHLVVPEVALHALLMHQRPQIPSEHQPVESRDHSSNLALVFRDKLVHGVFLPL